MALRGEGIESLADEGRRRPGRNQSHDLGVGGSDRHEAAPREPERLDAVGGLDGEERRGRQLSGVQE